MTKGTGQKHYWPENYEHAAHQADAAHRDGHDAARKAKSIEKGGAMQGGHPVDTHPKSLQKGQ